MDGGRMTQSGSYKDLLTEGTTFEQLVNAHRDAITTLDPSNYQTQKESEKEDMIQPDGSHSTNLSGDRTEGDISVVGVPGVQLTEDWLEVLFGLYFCFQGNNSSMLRLISTDWFF